MITRENYFDEKKSINWDLVDQKIVKGTSLVHETLTDYLKYIIVAYRVVVAAKPKTQDGAEPEPKRPRRTPEMSAVGWEAQDVVKAAQLLLPDGGVADGAAGRVQFSDEEEMRRVFTLLYDVFRCKFLMEGRLGYNTNAGDTYNVR